MTETLLERTKEAPLFAMSTRILHLKKGEAVTSCDVVALFKELPGVHLIMVRSNDHENCVTFQRAFMACYTGKGVELSEENQALHNHEKATGMKSGY